MDKNIEVLNEEENKKNDIISVGLDIGTMNIVCARSDSDNIRITRNVFLPLKEDEISISELTDISYVRSEDGIFIIGDDAFRFANIFNQKVCRPMESGLISPKELYAIDVLTLIVKDLMGDIKDKEAYVSYSVPAEAIDEGRSVIYHEKIFGKILASLGVNYKSVNEGSAIIYSECQEEKFSGVGISFGAGMSNVCLMFKGIEVLKFSTARSGDWIDKNVSESLNIVQNRITSIKEKYLDFENELTGSNKKVRRAIEALNFYYESLINYTIKRIIKEFEDKVEIEVDEKMPIVISGGTSLPKGFLNIFKNIISKYELPFEISDIRQAQDPLTCVANGLLIKTLADVGDKS